MGANIPYDLPPFVMDAIENLARAIFTVGMDQAVFDSDYRAFAQKFGERAAIGIVSFAQATGIPRRKDPFRSHLYVAAMAKPDFLREHGCFVPFKALKIFIEELP